MKLKKDLNKGATLKDSILKELNGMLIKIA